MKKNDMDISINDRTTEVLFSIKPSPVEFVFYSCGEEVGKFSYNEDSHEWSFIGNVDDSAKKFVEAISRYLPKDSMQWAVDALIYITKIGVGSVHQSFGGAAGFARSLLNEHQEGL